MLAARRVSRQVHSLQCALSSWCNSDPTKFYGASPAQAYNIGEQKRETFATMCVSVE